MKCRHYACRCVRAEQLARMAEMRGEPHLLVEAIAAHTGEVECRMYPDIGGPHPVHPTHASRARRTDG